MGTPWSRQGSCAVFVVSQYLHSVFRAPRPGPATTYIDFRSPPYAFRFVDMNSPTFRVCPCRCTRWNPRTRLSIKPDYAANDSKPHFRKLSFLDRSYARIPPPQVLSDLPQHTRPTIKLALVTIQPKVPSQKNPNFPSSFPDICCSELWRGTFRVLLNGASHAQLHSAGTNPVHSSGKPCGQTTI